MKIGDLARATGVKVVTIRHYEKSGLLPLPTRDSGNYRIYSADAVKRVSFVRRCRDLGFSLEQIRDLLELSSQTEQSFRSANRNIDEYLVEVEGKVGDLQALASELRRLSSGVLGSENDLLDAIAPD